MGFFCNSECLDVNRNMPFESRVENGMSAKRLGSAFKWMCALVGALIAIVAYWPGLQGGFFFDDASNIVENPALRLFDGSLSSLVDASVNGAASPLGRPLSMASFALNLYLSGLDPFGFKLVNLLIHLINGVLVFLVVGQLCGRSNGARGAGLLPLGVALLWVLHPLNLSPVLFVTQRMTSLAALFTLAALYFYLFGRNAAALRTRWSSFAVSFLVCWPAAVLAKESGLIFPLFALICELFPRRDGKQNISRRVLIALLSLGGIFAFCLGLYFWDVLFSGYRFRDFSLVERLLTESRVLWFHLAQLFFPLPDSFSLYHDDFQISRSLLLPPETLVSILGWCALIAFGLLAREKWPMLLYAVSWFLVGHILESSVLPLEIVHEHRNYLASLGPLVAFCWLLFPVAKDEEGYVPRVVLFISFTLFCALVTGLRAHQWGDEYRRAILEVAAHPDSARANYQAALIVIKRAEATNSLGNPMSFQAINYYLVHSSALDKDAKAPLIGLLYLACQVHLPRNEEQLTLLMERLSSARFSPGDLGVYKSLSGLLVENRLCLNDQEVERLLSASLENPQLDASAKGLILSVGMDYAFAKMKSMPLAMDYASRAMGVDPSNVSLRINLIHLLLKAGERERAVEAYAQFARMKIPAVQRKEIIELGQLLGFDGRYAS